MPDNTPAIPPPANAPSESQPPDVRVIAAWQALITAVLFSLAELTALVGAGMLFREGKIDLATLLGIATPVVGAAAVGRLRGKPTNVAGLMTMLGSSIGAKIAKGAGAATIARNLMAAAIIFAGG